MYQRGKRANRKRGNIFSKKLVGIKKSITFALRFGRDGNREIIRTAISGRVHRHNEAQPRKGTANKSPV